MASKSGNQGNMSQSMAQVLFHQGATLVFLDVPAGTEFGMDYNSWQVGPKFRGVKMIPPGIHFVYYSAVSKEGDTAPRTGFFHHFKACEVLVKKWDKITEDIKPEEVSAEEQAQMEANKQELDQYLGVYPYDSYKKWVSLTNHISSSTLEKLEPIKGKISSVTEFKSISTTTVSRREAAEAEKQEPPSDDSTEKKLPKMTLMPGTEIRFTQLPKRTYPEGATPEEVTKYSMDHSYVLQLLLDTIYKDNHKEILGELQFAFVCFLLGQVYDAFEQWKKLVRLLCTCEDILPQQVDLFSDFINVMHYHIQEIPEDFFVDIISANNFLTSTLPEFFSNIESNSDNLDREFVKKGLKFRDHLQKKFKWDFTSEPDEYAPVIVE